MEDPTGLKKAKTEDDKIELLNCTPHSISVKQADGEMITWRPETKVFIKVLQISDGVSAECGEEIVAAARCEATSYANDSFTRRVGVSVVSRPIYGVVYDLPKEQDNGKRGIIVSQIVAQALLDSEPSLWSGPVFSPDSGPESAIRNSDGAIIGVSRLILWKE